MERFCNNGILIARKINFAIFLLLSLSISHTVEAKYDFTVNGLYYRVVSLGDKTCALVNEREGENKIPVSNYKGDIVVPSTVTIGPRTFTVVEIGESAFYSSMITSVKVPGTVKTIGRFAFFECSYLQHIEIEDGVEEIGDHAFSKCGNIKRITKLKMPTTRIKSIGIGAFEEIRIEPEAKAVITIPASCMVVGEDAFRNSAYYKMIIADSRSPLTVHEDGLNSSAINSIYVGRNISYKKRGNYDGSGMWAANRVVFGDLVTSITERPGDVERDTLVFGKSLWAIPQIDSKEIGYLQVNSLNPPKMAGFVNSVYLNTVLHVPEGALTNYKNDPQWGKFWDIQEIKIQAANGAEIQNSLRSMVHEEEKPKESETIPYSQATERPTFQGGDAYTFSIWVNRNLQYPESAKAKKIQGRVTVQFTVDEEGAVQDVKLLRGVSPELDEEALRVISRSPKWTPAKSNGKTVRVVYNFPVVFQL